MKLGEWARRNDWVIVLVMALAGMSAIAFIDFAEAHAQKPAEQPLALSQIDKYALVTGHNSDGSWTLSPAFYQAIEQHCIAIYPDERYVLPGHTLKLRCTPDKEPQ